MSWLREGGFRSVYKGMSVSCSPETFRRNVKFLQRRYDLPRGEAMAAAYAVLAWACERTTMQARSGMKEAAAKAAIQRFLTPEELEMAEALVEQLRGEQPLTESVKRPFWAVYEVGISYLPERWNPHSDDMLPEAWLARVDGIKFRRGDQLTFEMDTPPVRSLFGQGETWVEAVNIVKRQMEARGLRGLLRIRHSDGGSDTMVLRPQAALTEEREMDELKEISEIDALRNRKTLVEQRPAVADVVKQIEDDLKKGILVSLARMMREMGYDRWPHDPEGREDIDKIIDAVSKDMVKMGRRFNQLMRDQLRVLRTRGPKAYERIIRRWLSGMPEGPEGSALGGAGSTGSTGTGDKAAADEAVDDVKDIVGKDVWNGMSLDERMDFLDEIGVDEPKAKDVAAMDWDKMEADEPEIMKMIGSNGKPENDEPKKDEPKDEKPKSDEPEKKDEPKKEPVAESKKATKR